MFWLTVPEFQFIGAEGVCRRKEDPIAEARSTQGMPAVVPEVSLSVLTSTSLPSEGDTCSYHRAREMA